MDASLTLCMHEGIDGCLLTLFPCLDWMPVSVGAYAKPRTWPTYAVGVDRHRKCKGLSPWLVQWLSPPSGCPALPCRLWSGVKVLQALPQPLSVVLNGPSSRQDPQWRMLVDLAVTPFQTSPRRTGGCTVVIPTGDHLQGSPPPR